MIRVLSLGAGVQSSTVLLMSCVGELPKLDAAVFADTGWEPRAVYEHLTWLEGEASRAGIPVYRVSAGNIRDDNVSAATAQRGRRSEGKRSASLPFYTRSGGGPVGAVKRQCTQDYKIVPVERQIRALCHLKPRQPWPKGVAVELWFGISCEEMRRMRLPEAGWKTHRYPLVWEKRFRREDCLSWLEANGFPPAPRSACIGCPFHSDSEWRAVKADREQWRDAVEFDEAIRFKGGMRGDLFLHRSGVPLVQVDLSTPEERGQQSLWGEECLGYCGV